MDITKSREEFEAWAEKNGYRMDLITDGDIYSYSSTRCSWEAWKASRESLVVAVPQRQALCASGYGDGYFVPSDSGEGLEYDEVVEALRTAGIRIKGESDGTK